MNFDLGMPTLIELESIQHCCELCSRLKLDFIELNMNLPGYLLSTMNIEELTKWKERYSIYFTIHLEENLNVCDFNPYVAAAYKATVIETIQIAKKLNVPVLNMHLAEGVYFTLPDQKVYLFEQYKEYYFNALKEFMKSCEEEIADSQITISIENCGGFQEFSREGIELLLSSPVFSLTFDIGHSHHAGNKDEKFLLGHIDRIKHMHLHDACGTKDHLVLGTGEIDLLDKIKIAKRNQCRCVLETKTVEGLIQSVEFLRNNSW